MLLQRAGTGTLPPIGFTSPEWTSLKNCWAQAPLPAEPAVTMGPADVTLGHDDIEAEDNDLDLATDVKGHSFGWDNESPKRTVHVPEFKIEWRPITNGEFYEFYHGAGKGEVKFPASWLQVGETTQVGPVYSTLGERCVRLLTHARADSHFIRPGASGNRVALAGGRLLRRPVQVRHSQRRSDPHRSGAETLLRQV
jgi:formylglycine-generating enzyme required for sulfatase activity